MGTVVFWQAVLVQHEYSYILYSWAKNGSAMCLLYHVKPRIRRLETPCTTREGVVNIFFFCPEMLMVFTIVADGILMVGKKCPQKI
jgi:hypothetical protein